MYIIYLKTHFVKAKVTGQRWKCSDRFEFFGRMQITSLILKDVKSQTSTPIVQTEIKIWHRKWFLSWCGDGMIRVGSHHPMFPSLLRSAVHVSRLSPGGSPWLPAPDREQQFRAPPRPAHRFTATPANQRRPVRQLQGAASLHLWLLHLLPGIQHLILRWKR